MQSIFCHSVILNCIVHILEALLYLAQDLIIDMCVRAVEGILQLVSFKDQPSFALEVALQYTNGQYLQASLSDTLLEMYLLLSFQRLLDYRGHHFTPVEFDILSRTKLTSAKSRLQELKIAHMFIWEPIGPFRSV